MRTQFKPGNRLKAFILLALFSLLLNSCMKFQKKAGSPSTIPERRVPPVSSLPSEGAAAILIQEGWKCIDDGHLPLAEQKFEDAIRLSATSGESYLGLAKVAYLQEDYPRALEFLEIGEAYSTHHSDLLLRFYLLERDCYQAMGKRKKAKEAYQKASEIGSAD